MSLIRRSTMPSASSLLSDFFDDDRFFYSPWLRGQSMPAVNIKDNEKNYEVEVAAPGYSKGDFNISVDNGMLTISAERKQESEKTEDNYTRKEFGYESFSRSFNLPQNTSEDDVQARYEDGVLKLTIAKKSDGRAKTRKSIEIK